MRDVDSLKKKSAKVFYRDKVGGTYDYVEGVVVDWKPVQEANKAWDQHWSRSCGTILKIEPKEKSTVSVRFRHLSSVLTPEQHEAKKRRKSNSDSSTKSKSQRRSRRNENRNR